MGHAPPTRDEQGRRRGNRTTALDEGEVAACPECNSSHVTMNGPGGMKQHMDLSKRYRCVKCQHHFDEYVIRDEQRAGGPKRGLAKDLAAADPDEVSR